MVFRSVTYSSAIEVVFWHIRDFVYKVIEDLWLQLMSVAAQSPGITLLLCGVDVHS